MFILASRLPVKQVCELTFGELAEMKIDEEMEAALIHVTREYEPFVYKYRTAKTINEKIAEVAEYLGWDIELEDLRRI